MKRNVIIYIHYYW